MESFDYIKRNYLSLNEEIEALAARLGTKAPTLVSVTKSGSDEELLELIKAGASDIGENRPGELARRGELIRASGLSARMHEIGTLQRNKIKLIGLYGRGEFRSKLDAVCGKNVGGGESIHIE